MYVCVCPIIQLLPTDDCHGNEKSNDTTTNHVMGWATNRVVEDVVAVVLLQVPVIFWMWKKYGRVCIVSNEYAKFMKHDGPYEQ